jgi:hypothetical protein
LRVAFWELNLVALKATVMQGIRLLCAAASVIMTGAFSHAWAAAPDALELDTPTATVAAPAIGAPLIEHQLDVKMTVRNWVLCTTQPLAETLVHAREESPAAAEKAFADLAAARSCGLFPEMQVILQKPIYETMLHSGGQAKVYGALINISGAWASGYVVYGGVPEN